MRLLATLSAAALIATPAIAQEYRLQADAWVYQNGALLSHNDPDYSGSAADSANGQAYSWEYGAGAGASSNLTGVLEAWAFSSPNGNPEDPEETGVVPSPDGEISARATALWETTVTNTHGIAADYSFHFDVMNPLLVTKGVDGDVAGLYLDILLNGTSIWNAAAELNGTTLTHDAAFVPDPSWSYGKRQGFNSFSAIANLGTILAGQTFTLSYALSAFSASSTQEVDAAPVWASIGDPAALAPQLRWEPATDKPLPVSEPASWSLLLAGLGLLGFANWRRRIRTKSA